MVGVDTLIDNGGHYPLAGICLRQILSPLQNIVDSRRLAGKIHLGAHPALKLQRPYALAGSHTLNVAVGHLHNRDVASAGKHPYPLGFEIRCCRAVGQTGECQSHAAICRRIFCHAYEPGAIRICAHALLDGVPAQSGTTLQVETAGRRRKNAPDCHCQ